MSTTLAINPMPLSVPNTPPSDVNVSLVNVKDMRLVKEIYGQSGEVFKLLWGMISGKLVAYVLQAPNGEQMPLKDLQGNLVTDPGEVERIVQMITGGQLTAGPFVAVPLAGHALVLVAAAIGTFSWSYLSATTKQQKEEALNQFGEAIKDVVKKFPEQAGNIYQHIQETLNTWGGKAHSCWLGSEECSVTLVTLLQSHHKHQHKHQGLVTQPPVHQHKYQGVMIITQPPVHKHKHQGWLITQPVHKHKYQGWLLTQGQHQYNQRRRNLKKI